MCCGSIDVRLDIRQPIGVEYAVSAALSRQDEASLRL
jgi:hypothetical protein